MGKIDLDENDQLEALRKVLGIAFSEDSLKTMLRLEMKCRWDEIKEGADYEKRLFNLIEKAESEGQVEKLIFSAAKRQSENSDIQEFIENNIRNSISKLIEFNVDLLTATSLISLLNILKTLSDFQVIEKLVRRIVPATETNRPENIKNFSNSNLSNWFKCFTVLKLLLEDYPGEPEQRPNILTFVENLLKEEQLDDSIKKQLKKWMQEIDPNFNDRDSNSETNPRNVKPTVSGALQAYLMIVVNPEKKTQLRAIASLLCISTTGVRKEIPVHLDSESNERGVLCTMKKLPTFIGKFIQKSILLLENPDFLLGCDYYDDLTVELFLPIDYLCEPVDCWKIKNTWDNLVNLGCEHRLVVRSYDRLVKPSLKNAFSKSWHSAKEFLEQKPDVASLQNKIQRLDKIDCDRLMLLQAELEQKIGLKVICALPKSEREMIHFLQVMLMSGIPIAFWIRCSELPSCEVATIIDRFLTTQLLLNSCELLEKVRLERISAFSCEMLEKHCGRHLSVLWDNWERRPTIESLDNGGQRSR
jgi:vWA-MoxR associated protein C-terminal domain/vWA-MoxR associated protein middle region (VMAP-M) 1/Effector-associated domain 1